MCIRFIYSHALWLSVLAAAVLDNSAAAADSDFFETRIRPVLADNCFDCHSEQSDPPRSGLRLDSREASLKGGERGPAVRPGHPEESLLYQAVTHKHSKLVMPHKRPKLSDAVLKDIKGWIQDGAIWPELSESETTRKPAFDLAARKARLPWIWETPVEQEIPNVMQKDWPRSDLDNFILAGLEKSDLSPAKDANRRTWFRRVSFALTGLPPTPKAINEFLEDPSPNSREKVIDALLTSPHFGERWARHWMDLVRYAESRGHESDFIIPNAYHYRDYLIRSFNEDLPYRQLVLEHVAGDLLSEPRLNPKTEANESVLATGWAFLGEEVHSPVDIRQDECDRLDNKVDVFSKTFLGMTVSCARCHDHKFDALKTRDYYALTGFFLSSSYRQVRFESMEHNRRVAQKLAELRLQHGDQARKDWSKAASSRLKDVQSWLSAAARLIKVKEPERDAVLREFVRDQKLDETQIRLWMEYLMSASKDSTDPFRNLAKLWAGKKNDPSETLQSSNPNGWTFPLPEGARIVADYTSTGNSEGKFWRTDGFGFGSGPVRIGDLVISEDEEAHSAEISTYGSARRDLFWKHLKLKAGNETDPGNLAATSRAGQMIRTRTTTLESGQLHYLIRGSAQVYAAVDSHIMIAGPLHGKIVRKFETGTNSAPQWVTHDLGDYVGHRLHVEFGPVDDHELEVLMVVDAKDKPTNPEIPTWPNLAKNPATPEAMAQSVTDMLREAIATFAEEGFNDNVPLAVVANWMVRHSNLLGMDDVFVNTDYVQDLKKLHDQVRWESRTAVSWLDGNGINEHVLLRGKPFSKGEVAPRALPEAISGSKSISSDKTSNRLALAQQLIDPENPLVARVMVNRVWHHLFGRGIISSVDNFGYLGERPTHPELLDHLAWQFIHKEDWSLKKLIRKLVLSRTYTMDSVASASQADEVDPTNKLLHRMPIRRLEAEVIRDALLAVSGRFSTQVLGSPVPVHLTEFVIGRGRPNKSGPLDGNGRRSIYTSVRRNFLPTFMLTFDYPTPFSTMGRRNVTNVPAQSLALMNDELFHQQALVWADRLLSENPQKSQSQMIQHMFETAYSRLPEPDETAACQQTLEGLQNLQDDSQAWAELAHALLNANEFVYVR